MTANSILARMDAALAKASARGLEPNVFYLTTQDRDRFNAEISADWGSPCYGFSWRDVQIRRGETSKLYGLHGIGISIPKAAPPVDRRVRRAARKGAAEAAQRPVGKRKRR